MCGTHAFGPLCAYIVWQTHYILSYLRSASKQVSPLRLSLNFTSLWSSLQDEEKFVMSSQPEEGRDKCPYGPTTGYTGLIVGKSVETLAFIDGWEKLITSRFFRPADLYCFPVWIPELSGYPAQLSISHTEDRRCSYTLAGWWVIKKLLYGYVGGFSSHWVHASKLRLITWIEITKTNLEKNQIHEIFPTQRQNLWAHRWWERAWTAAPEMTISCTSSLLRGAMNGPRPTARAEWQRWPGFVK